MTQSSPANLQQLKNLILGFSWEDGNSLAEQADHWVKHHLSWIHGIKWSQWQGLRRQAEEPRRWEDLQTRLIEWMSDSAKDKDANGIRPPRRAWALSPHGHAPINLRESLMKAIETATIPPQSKRWKSMQETLDANNIPPKERDEIDQYLRVQRARRFLDLLLMTIRLETKDPQ